MPLSRILALCTIGLFIAAIQPLHADTKIAPSKASTPPLSKLKESFRNDACRLQLSLDKSTSISPLVEWKNCVLKSPNEILLEGRALKRNFQSFVINKKVVEASDQNFSALIEMEKTPQDIELVMIDDKGKTYGNFFYLSKAPAETVTEKRVLPFNLDTQLVFARTNYLETGYAAINQSTLGAKAEVSVPFLKERALVGTSLASSLIALTNRSSQTSTSDLRLLIFAGYDLIKKINRPTLHLDLGYHLGSVSGATTGISLYSGIYGSLASVFSIGKTVNLEPRFSYGLISGGGLTFLALGSNHWIELGLKTRLKKPQSKLNYFIDLRYQTLSINLTQIAQEHNYCLGFGVGF